MCLGDHLTAQHQGLGGRGMIIPPFTVEAPGSHCWFPEVPASTVGFSPLAISSAIPGGFLAAGRFLKGRWPGDVEALLESLWPR